MARQYQVMEIAAPDGTGSGRYHYVCQQDDRIDAVGYCATQCPGHASPQDACDHYKQYLVDEADYTGLWNRWCRCDHPGCLSMSNRYAKTGRFVRTLCDRHLNPTDLRQCLSVGERLLDW